MSDRGVRPSAAAQTELMSDSFSDYMRDTDTVTVSTKRASGTSHETSIWAVTVDGVPYVRSVNGPHAHWYQEALRGDAAIVMPSGPMAVRFTPTDDPSMDKVIDAAYTAKYSMYPKRVWQPELTDTARRCTLTVTAKA
jgi:hypothetical protein